MRRLGFVLLLIILGAGISRAQITLTAFDELKVMDATRIRVYSSVFPGGERLTVGSAGSGYVWDLSPYAQSYSEDTVVLNHDIDLPLDRRATHAYVYYLVPQWYPEVTWYELNHSGKYYHGVSPAEQYHPPSYLYDPPRPELRFPLTLGSQWSHADQTVYMFARFGDSSWVGTYSMDANVDASGILRLPGGDYECLRLKRFMREEGSTTVRYEFLAKEKIRAEITIMPMDSSLETPRVQRINITYYDAATSVDDVPTSPAAVHLSPNYPDPFRTLTTFGYGIPQRGHVRIGVFDLLGREVAIPVDGILEQGRHTALFNGSKLPAGTYLYRIEYAGKTVTRRMTLLK